MILILVKYGNLLSLDIYLLSGGYCLQCRRNVSAEALSSLTLGFYCSMNVSTYTCVGYYSFVMFPIFFPHLAGYRLCVGILHF